MGVDDTHLERLIAVTRGDVKIAFAERINLHGLEMLQAATNDAAIQSLNGELQTVVQQSKGEFEVMRRKLENEQWQNHLKNTEATAAVAAVTLLEEDQSRGAQMLAKQNHELQVLTEQNRMAEAHIRQSEASAESTVNEATVRIDSLVEYGNRFRNLAEYEFEQVLRFQNAKTELEAQIRSANDRITLMSRSERQDHNQWEHCVSTRDRKINNLEDEIGKLQNEMVDNRDKAQKCALKDRDINVLKLQLSKAESNHRVASDQCTNLERQCEAFRDEVRDLRTEVDTYKNRVGSQGLRSGSQPSPASTNSSPWMAVSDPNDQLLAFQQIIERQQDQMKAEMKAQNETMMRVMKEEISTSRALQGTSSVRKSSPVAASPSIKQDSPTRHAAAGKPVVHTEVAGEFIPEDVEDDDSHSQSLPDESTCGRPALPSPGAVPPPPAPYASSTVIGQTQLTPRMATQINSLSLSAPQQGVPVATQPGSLTIDAPQAASTAVGPPTVQALAAASLRRTNNPSVKSSKGSGHRRVS